MFSKKATKNDENFTVDLAFLEKINFDSILCYQDKVRVSFHEKKILCSKSGETRLEKQSGVSAAAGRAPAARWPRTTSDGCRTTGGDAGGTLQP